MELDWPDHEGHPRFPRHSALKLLAGHAVGLAILYEDRARLEPVEIHVVTFAFFMEPLDPFETAWAGTVVVFPA